MKDYSKGKIYRLVCNETVNVVKKKNRLLKEIEDYNTGPTEKRNLRSKNNI